ncbi:MAG: DUF5103 domain-containing protein [Tannerellaceae bacterium]|jgi:hypothetical protein|nr:DUF5103 domain-containing protein [Tannerellaceae bacterium]
MNKRKTSGFCCFFILSGFCALAQPAQTGTNSSMIQTLRVSIADEPLSDPLIELGGNKQVEINFDALEQNFNRFAYSIEHCEADWNRSSLVPVEYMNGFSGLTIDDFANAIATTTPYTNYRLLLPNEEVQFKISGNYAVRIYRENEPDKILLTACFSVVEPLLTISAEVSGNTLNDFNGEHQQLNFFIDHKNLSVTHPQTDIKLFVYQNRRRDNAVTGLRPSSILNNRLVYDHNRDLIFEAGNEYRRIEFLSHTYNGIGVENIQFHNPFYHTTLQTDFPRARRSYQYDEDQNGRFLIRCSRCADPDTEADYDIVHFTLQSEPYPDGEVYIQSDIYNNVLNEKSRMEYNYDTGAYEKAVLLKQGNYNYQYLFVPDGSTCGETSLLEGNYYQTENEYTLFVWYRPFGARYDRLVGTSIVTK